MKYRDDIDLEFLLKCSEGELDIKNSELNMVKDFLIQDKRDYFIMGGISAGLLLFEVILIGSEIPNYLGVFASCFLIVTLNNIITAYRINKTKYEKKARGLEVDISILKCRIAKIKGENNE